MNTKLLMMASSLVLGLAGVVALFAPDYLLTLLHAPTTNPLPVLIQLLGAVYLSLAAMNWTAKNHAIGGIYARPVSLANFAHFFIGALLLANYLLSNGFNYSASFVGGVYAVFAVLFYWLVFRHTGITAGENAQ